ncbi:aliphatic sulfonate ABC transporter substrate-binding protein [Xanthobacter dioxanivorans]|uniref:Aliphatic sulfonate ABC transporter substrate-binding protein n=1 Tax=Xanthobacter dioxanivorans TaxID=2528964 RepID=A0A974PT94_9HYPH|nr:NrtA/SsuA/CpmA family ABC transporter substrate-binding protein [Xanthobacter dioxanivorans]QRG09136.1 aliphatic sulfonate ABC transporter substrate-binding protein [Xanthobacter dioxanivorans]
MPRLKSSALLIAALLAMCPAAASAELLKTRLAQNLSPISGITIIAKAKGFFEKAGLDVTVSNFTSGKQALDTVIGGGADIATTAEAPVTAAAMAGQPIAFVAGMEYSDVKTLARAGAGIKSAADLKGKKIAFTAGTGSEVYTTELLKTAGLTTRDVTLVNLKPQEMLPALAAGSIDGFNTWEPHISNARKALGADVQVLDTKGVYSETFNIVVMQDYLKAHPQIIEKFLAAMLESEAWMKANPDEAVSVIAQAAGMKPEDLKALWNDYVFHVAIGAKQVRALKTHAQWRLDTKNHPPGVTGVPDFAVLIFPDPLRKLDPTRVDYKLD